MILADGSTKPHLQVSGALEHGLHRGNWLLSGKPRTPPGNEIALRMR